MSITDSPMRAAATERLAADDGIGAPKVHVTFFEDFKAKTRTTDTLTLAELCERVLNASAREKGKLPWLKLASFGTDRSAKGSLRHDANVLEITGCELDYDGEQISFAAALTALKALRIHALIYTSPSHSPARPRWRILAPTSRHCQPHMRAKMVARINGYLKTELGAAKIAEPESFTLSQAYYYGWVMNKPDLDHRAEATVGNFIDLRDDLSMFEASGGPASRSSTGSQAGNTCTGSSTKGKEKSLPTELLRLIREGVPAGQDRSVAFHHAVKGLKELRWSVDDIVALLARYPNGIARKYGLRFAQEVERSFNKPEEDDDHQVGEDQEEEDERDAQSSAGNTSSTNSGSSAPGAGSSASANGASPGMGSNSSQKLPLYIEIAKTFLLRMATGFDELLRQVPDLKGSVNVWKCSAGLWSLSSDQEAVRLLAPVLQEIVIAANQEKKSSVKLFNEAARHILRSADVCKGGEVAWDAHGKVLTLDGLIDPITNRIEPFKPEHYATWRLPVRHDPAATCPHFEQMLMDNFAEMTEGDRLITIQLLQELLGVALIDNKPKSLSRAAVFLGGGDTGKTVLLKIITGLFGGSITTTFAKLDGSHGLQAFTQRLPWILGEAFNQSGWYFSDLVKSVLTGDPVEINPKHARAITQKVNAPAFWGTNHPPKFKEASGTMATRMMIIPMTRTYDKRNPIGVAAEARRHNPAWEPSDLIINTELPGVLNWARVGLKRALERGYFINTKIGEDLLEQSRRDSNSVAGFLAECITHDLTVMTSCADFYVTYEVWWREQHGDRSVAPSRTTVGQDLASIPNSRIAQDKAKFRRDTGERFYLGCMLSEAGKALWQIASNKASITGDRVAHMSQEVKQTIKPISPDSWKETEEYLRIVANTKRFKKQAEAAKKDRATPDEKEKAGF
jgi:hypothetical protein